MTTEAITQPHITRLGAVHLHEALRAWRNERRAPGSPGRSFRQLARQIGVDASIVLMWALPPDHPRHRPVPLRRLAALAPLLGRSMANLLAYQAAPEPPVSFAVHHLSMTFDDGRQFEVADVRGTQDADISGEAITGRLAAGEAHPIAWILNHLAAGHTAICLLPGGGLVPYTGPTDGLGTAQGSVTLLTDTYAAMSSVIGAARWIEEDGWTPATRDRLMAALRNLSADQPLDLHAHAGHQLVIGHDAPAYATTTLWCDTCDQAVLVAPNDSACQDAHLSAEPESAHA
jgi:hypothetical protein